MSLNSLTNEEILKDWNQSLDFEKRDLIVEQLVKRGLFPSNATREWEEITGSPPLTEDPQFVDKLLSKREFTESLQKNWKPSDNVCDPDKEFETTPVQRFVSTLMNPKNPYRSVLLYHGVGVGKTCASIQIAESWLDAFPRDKVIVIAPSSIRDNFLKTIFNPENLIIDVNTNIPNKINGCLGNKYLTLTGTEYEKNRDKIQHLVSKTIQQRYAIYGYISFAKYIKSILVRGTVQGATSEDIEKHQLAYLRKEFSGKLLIVDEAHNLRDKTEDGEDTDKELEGIKKEDGKILTPFLNKVVQNAEGLKLVLLSATPMYNSYKEIIYILNLLLTADKKPIITALEIFDTDGNISPEGKTMLSRIASRYVSFMRGENPISFPIRLNPIHVNSPSYSYPNHDPRGGLITDEQEKDFVNHLPIVQIPLQDESLKASMELIRSLTEGEKGVSSIMVDKIAQAENFVTPVWWDSGIHDYNKQTLANSYLNILKKSTIGGEIQYSAQEGKNIDWLLIGRLQSYSPKFDFFLRRIEKSEGIIFTYSRFVNMGCIILALALEMNGYTAYGRKHPLLLSDIKSPRGRKCARCSKYEKEHSEIEIKHFLPAKYVLLTGDSSHSPDNDKIIADVKKADNINGEMIKVIVGSQITSEGVDFKYIREIHVMEGWFHLNKTEQILGRGNRFCSHIQLSPEKRNLTTYIYMAVFPQGVWKDQNARETADEYCYRIAFKKARKIGNVSRILKQSAMDCNLNHGANIISDTNIVRQIDSQNNERNIRINDTPFTAICDWIETCSYTCNPVKNVVKEGTDESTYDEYFLKWKLNNLKNVFQQLFETQSFHTSEDIYNLFDEMKIPQNIKIELFQSVVDNKNFKVIHKGREGYIHYCNTYFLFQPFIYEDTRIPLSIRSATFPVKRDEYIPQKSKKDIEFSRTSGVAESKLNREEDGNNIDDNIELVKNWFLSTKSWLIEATISRKIKKDDMFIPIPPNKGIRKGIVIIEEAKSKKSKSTVFDLISGGINLFLSRVFSSKQKIPNELIQNIILEFCWDRFISVEEKVKLIHLIPEEVEMMENMYLNEELKIYRFLKKNKTVEYWCDNHENRDSLLPSKCKRSIVEDMEENKEDPLKIPITSLSTGSIYGFMVFKKDKMIFKTTEPPEKTSDGLKMGDECANVSTVSLHIQKIALLGTYLREIEKDDLGLDEHFLTSLSNAVKTCAVLELILRYLDKIRLKGKRWFYRPLESHYKGHVGK